MRSVPMVCTASTEMPGVSLGMMNMVRPLCLGRSGSVRVSRMIQSASWAIVVHIFAPLITHSSPSSTALVLIDATSEP